METSPEIEKTLMDAFLEDDYEGGLHLTTLSMQKKQSMHFNDDDRHCGDDHDSGRDEEVVVGLAFWREVPNEEMSGWLDLRRISEIIARYRAISSNSATNSRPYGLLTYGGSASTNFDDAIMLSPRGRKAMKLVRSNSISWIESAIASSQNQAINDNAHANEVTTISSTVRELTHSWIKVELIAIQKSYRSHHLGNILLGCTLARAHELYHKEHAVLHVAGGGATKNIPASRLYSRYGFVAVPRHEEGGPFCRPDRDLFVLGDIGGTLEHLPWGEMLNVAEEHASPCDEGDGCEKHKRKAETQDCD